ncbi:hypothetical protein [Persephonella sp.]
MDDLKNVRKLKVIIKKDGKELDTEYINKVINETDNVEIRNFLIGCRHTIERHYTEGIKWFQLSNFGDSVLMILILSYKIGDSFMFNEYYTDDLKGGDLLNKLGFEVFVRFGDREFKLDKYLIDSIFRLNFSETKTN